MRTEPYDLLTDEDKELIIQYIHKTAGVVPLSLPKVLGAWNHNKRTLFKMLGNKLRIKVPITIPLDDQLYIKMLQNIYTPIQIDNFKYPIGVADKDLNKYIVENYNQNHPFIAKWVNYLNDNFIKKGLFLTSDEINLAGLLNYNNIVNNIIDATKEYYNPKTNKTLKIQKGSKTIKAIRKVLLFYDFPDMDVFEKWRNDLSNISTSNKNYKGYLTLSLHPIDYMTMSDNNCNWTSCMGWLSKGAYSTGTLEMLNSNVMLIAYLESSSKDFTFNGFKIPNKSFRVLVCAHKDIIVVGKSYPYYNKQLSLAALRAISDLAYKNLHWKYQYKNQLYKDLIRVSRNDYLLPQNRFSDFEMYKHRIRLYTYGMYNDMVEDHMTDYWCNRNYVKHSKAICISGRPTCLCCGKPLDEDLDLYDDDDFAGHGSGKICSNCIDMACQTCSIRSLDTNYYDVPMLTIQTQFEPLFHHNVLDRHTSMTHFYHRTYTIEQLISFILRSYLREKEETLENYNIGSMLRAMDYNINLQNILNVSMFTVSTIYCEDCVKQLLYWPTVKKFIALGDAIKINSIIDELKKYFIKEKLSYSLPDKIIYRDLIPWKEVDNIEQYKIENPFSNSF